MRALLAALALALAAPAQAQLDFGRILDLGKKAVEVGQKVQEATKEYTVEEEIALGEGITTGFLGAIRLHPDERLQRYVNRVGRWLASQTERADLPWTFGVIDTEIINAFAMPGGTVVVSHGLVKRLGSESELAGVLAHEIAHVLKKHQLSAIQSDAGWSAAATGAKAVAADQIARRGGGDVMGIKTQLANAGVDLVKDGLFLRPLDRSMEYEADRLGVVVAARGGYDPYGFVAVLTMLAQVKPEETGVSITFSTHPSPADRLAELEKVMPELEKYAGQPQVEGRFRQAVK
ncbi:MAG TPA: M48 family metallopeptidase [Usitatibacteraceae bacterium]|nr:M48 family metallopeptidase [Burkholderiales bacterium]HQW37805.1 M48 family metallopeptidase [Usitatibacteraceae bacterium]HRA23126.1 M48 family metallopeptidase [Usitatibacteraceae bacterium]